MVPAAKLGDIFAMARIGMPKIDLFYATFDVNNQVVAVRRESATAACATSSAGSQAALATFAGHVAAVLKASGKDGMLFQAQTGAILYVSDQPSDLIVVCARDFHPVEECHCG